MKRLSRLDDLFSARRTVWWIHGAGVTLLISAVLATEALVVAPIRFETYQEMAQIDLLESLLRKGESIRADFSQQKQRLEEEKKRQALLHQRVPDEPMEAAFLAQIADLARSLNLEVKDYRPGTTLKHADYSELKIEMQVEGSYRSICLFLDQVSRLPRISSFTGMEISADPEKSIYPIRLNFSTYFVPMSTDSREVSKG
jgi:type IV pilus assembly protein PilO